MKENGYGMEWMARVEVKAPMYVWRKEGGAETGNKFNSPTTKRRYVKILALCLVPLPASVIYRGVKHPLMKQVRDMCRAGLLDRYEAKGERRYYYQTTKKGIALISEALDAERDQACS